MCVFVHMYIHIHTYRSCASRMKQNINYGNCTDYKFKDDFLLSIHIFPKFSTMSIYSFFFFFGWCKFFFITNSHNIKFIILKVHTPLVFSIFTKVCNHHHDWFWITFNTPQNPICVSSHSHPLPFEPWHPPILLSLQVCLV